MQITRIGYGELKTGFNYDNKRLYVEAELSKTDDPVKVYETLKNTVQTALNEGQLKLDI